MSGGYWYYTFVPRDEQPGDLGGTAYREAIERAQAFVVALQTLDPSVCQLREHVPVVVSREGLWRWGMRQRAAFASFVTPDGEAIGWTCTHSWLSVEVRNFVDDLTDFMNDAPGADYRLSSKEHYWQWDKEQEKKPPRWQDIGLAGLLDAYEANIDDAVSEAEAARWA